MQYIRKATYHFRNFSTMNFNYNFFSKREQNIYSYGFITVLPVPKEGLKEKQFLKHVEERVKKYSERLD